MAAQLGPPKAMLDLQEGMGWWLRTRLGLCETRESVVCAKAQTCSYTAALKQPQTCPGSESPLCEMGDKLFVIRPAQAISFPAQDTSTALLTPRAASWIGRLFASGSPVVMLAARGGRGAVGCQRPARELSVSAAFWSF